MKESFKPSAVVFALILLATTALAQNDTRRTTVAITYPLNQTIEVAFHGTTRLTRLKARGSCTPRWAWAAHHPERCFGRRMKVK